VVAEFHRGVIDPAVGASHLGTELAKTKRSREKLQSAGDIFI
jgi:hypothetical protein